MSDLTTQLVSSKINGGSQAPPLSLSNYYLPANYQVSLDINHRKPNFQGTLKIDLSQNTKYSGATPTSFEIRLHANKLVIVRASLNGSQDLKISYDRAQQQVILSCDTKDEAKFIELQFMGQLNTTKTYRDVTYGLFKTNYSDSITGKSDNFIIATHTQPTGCRLIFPSIDELHHKVPIDLTITTQSSFKVISTGSLQSKQDVDMSANAVFKFNRTPPMATSVFGFVVGDLDYVSATIPDIGKEARVYTTKGDSQLGQYALQTITKLIPVISDLFKVALPLDKIDFITLPFLSDMAMENWGMITIIAPQLLLDPLASSLEARRGLRQLVAHELIHQWIGNWITFDDWRNIWLNESMATWLGEYALYVAHIDDDDVKYFELNQVEFIEGIMDRDCFYNEVSGDSILSIAQYTSRLDVNLTSTTSTLFDKDAYERGLILLRMIGGLLQYDANHGQDEFKLDYSEMCARLGHFIKSSAGTSFKPFQMWQALGENTSVDIASFAQSWCQYAGYPLVKVSSVKETKVVLEQHRFLYNATAADFNLEDQPYHVPLFIKYINDKHEVKILNVLLTDRRTEIDIPAQQILSVNHNKIGYYKVIYDESIKIGGSIEKMNEQEQISLINDYGKVLGQHQVANNDELNTLIQIFTAISKSSGVSWPVLRVALNYVEIVNHIMMHFLSGDDSKWSNWVSTFIDAIHDKVGDWDAINQLSGTSDYNAIEYQVRNSILQIGYTKGEFQTYAAKLYKNFQTGKTWIPQEMLSSVFNLTMAQAGQKEYKQILSLVKNANVPTLKNTNAQVSDLQTVAVSSLSFCGSEDLLAKTLNFVMTNIDSKLIELALVGFKYKRDRKAKLQLWHWYKVNYDQFIGKSLRKGSDWAKQIGVTMSNISKLVLGEVMQFDRELVDQFVKDKLTKLPDHKLKELVEEIDVANEEKIVIAGYYSTLKV